jgi:structure-specific recognition protein 1
MNTPASQPKSKKGRPDELSEIRFYVPGTHEGDDDEEVSAAQAFHDLIKDKADIGQVIGDVLVSFSEVNIQTPRYVLFLLDISPQSVSEKRR